MAPENCLAMREEVEAKETSFETTRLKSYFPLVLTSVSLALHSVSNSIFCPKSQVVENSCQKVNFVFRAKINYF